MKQNFGKVVGVLAGLLLLAAVILLFARDDSFANPTLTSTGASGLGAYGEVLRRQGFEVAREPARNPELAPTDVAIVPEVVVVGWGEDLFLGEEEEEAEPPDNPVVTALQAHLDAGGTVVVLRFGIDFSSRAGEAREPTRLASSLDGLTELSLNISNLEGGANPVRPMVPSFEVARTEDIAFERVHSAGSGRLVEVRDAIGATNRFLGREDNAEYFVGLAQRYAPGKRLVFVEGLFRPVEDPGLLAGLGGWAVALAAQAVLLAGIALFRMGQRFGVAREESESQRSSRELMDAVGEVLRRGRHAPYALEMVLDDVRTRLRDVLRLPRGASDGEMLRRLPAEVVSAFNDAVATSRTPVSGKAAAQAAKRLLVSVASFEKDRRAR